jgi:hypothetical protein
VGEGSRAPLSAVEHDTADRHLPDTEGHWRHRGNPRVHLFTNRIHQYAAHTRVGAY